VLTVYGNMYFKTGTSIVYIYMSLKRKDPLGFIEKSRGLPRYRVSVSTYMTIVVKQVVKQNRNQKYIFLIVLTNRGLAFTLC
jgi:hypothetical protein